MCLFLKYTKKCLNILSYRGTEIFTKVIILGSFKIHILHARPKPDKDVKCPGVVPG